MPLFKTFGKNLGLKITSKQPTVNTPKVVSVVEDGSTIVEAMTPTSNQYNWTSDFRFSDEIELIKKFRDMSLNVYCDRIICEIVNECIANNDMTGTSVSIDLDRTDFDENVKAKIIEEFDVILGLMNFNNKGASTFRDFYIDGRIFFHKVVDPKSPHKGIVELRRIDALDIKKIKQVVRKIDEATGALIIEREEEFFQYCPYMEYNNGSISQQNLIFNLDAVAYANSGLYLYQEEPSSNSSYHTNLTVGNKYVISYLYSLIKPLNQLNIVEESTIISQVARAPERRIHYVDISGMASSKGEAALRQYAAAIKNDLQYNSNTGDYNNATHTYSMQEDLIIPRRNGTNTSEITSLPGNSGNEDVKIPEYFKMKTYMASHVPLSRLSQDAQSFLGRASEINRDELNFSKFCNNLRENFSELFLDILKTQLLLKNIVSLRDWSNNKNLVRFQYSSDTYISQLREIEMFQEKINAVRDADNYVGKYFSKKFVMKNILQYTDEQLEEMNKEISEEGSNQTSDMGQGLDQSMEGMPNEML